MIISLLHPSRGRPQQAFDQFKNWMAKKVEHDIEHILCIDENDAERKTYENLLFPKIIISTGSDVVSATNQAAKESTGQILVFMADDFDPPQGWDKIIVDRMVKPGILKVYDGLQKYDIQVLTCPIMHREVYLLLGYFWHPLYKSMFVDEDLYHTAVENDLIIKCPDVTFQHKHPANNQAPNDATYIHTSQYWEQGKEVFRLRKLQGFQL